MSHTLFFHIYPSPPGGAKINSLEDYFKIFYRFMDIIYLINREKQKIILQEMRNKELMVKRTPSVLIFWFHY